MNKWPFLLAVLTGTGLSLSCTKNVPTSVSGDDYAELDQLSAELEELRINVQVRQPTCNDWCTTSRNICNISDRICELAKNHLDREEVQKQCAGAQEDCARFNEHCDRCQR